MHHGLVRLVFKVALPTTPKLRRWPTIHSCQFSFGGPDLDTGVDTIGRERSGTFDIPLVDDFLLNLWFAAHEVIERFGTRLCAVYWALSVIFWRAGRN